MKARSIGLLPLVGLLVVGTACGKKGDPVQESLDALVAAAKDRNTSDFFDRVASDFHSADGSGRAEAERLVRRYFTAYEILDVSIQDLAIERSENAALARFRANLSGQPQKLGGLDKLFPSAAAYRFELRLVPEGKLWKVAWASYTPEGGGG